MKLTKKLLFISVTLLFMAIIATNLSLASVYKSFLSIGIGYFTICFLVHFFVYTLRSLCMYLFVSKEVGFIYLLNAHFIHNFYLHIVPASMGELSLPLLLNKYVRKARTLAILLLTRIVTILYFLALSVLSVIILFRKTLAVKFDISYKHVLIAVFVLSILLLIITAVNTKFLGKAKAIRSLRTKLNNFILQFKLLLAQGLGVKKIVLLLLFTLLYILSLSLFYNILLSRLNINLNFVELVFVMSIQVAILILPIRSFGGFGTTEGAWLLGLSLLGIERSLALESGFVIHIINLFSAGIYFLIGIIYKYFMDKASLKQTGYRLSIVKREQTQPTTE